MRQAYLHRQLIQTFEFTLSLLVNSVHLLSGLLMYCINVYHVFDRNEDIQTFFYSSLIGDGDGNNSLHARKLFSFLLHLLNSQQKFIAAVISWSNRFFLS